MTSEHQVSSCDAPQYPAAGLPGWGPAPQLMVIYICRHTLSEWDNDYRSEQAGPCRVIFVCIWCRVYLLGCRLARGISQALTSVILVIAD